MKNLLKILVGVAILLNANTAKAQTPVSFGSFR